MSRIENEIRNWQLYRDGRLAELEGFYEGKSCSLCVHWNLTGHGTGLYGLDTGTCAINGTDAIPGIMGCSLFKKKGANYVR